MAFKDYRDIIRQMEREMQQMSDEAFRGFFGGTGRFWMPPVDIHETNEALIVKLELAGARAEDIQVALSPDDRILTIGGARGEGKEDREGRLRCHQLEIYFGPFERAIAMPSNLAVDREKIKAIYKDGFLSVVMPKRVANNERPKTRVIPITDVENSAEEVESEVEKQNV